MRISDWSSDVCSSDLIHDPEPAQEQGVDLGGQDQRERVDPEDDGELLLTDTETFLEDERRSGDVGEHRGHHQSTDQGDGQEGTIAEQGPIGADAGADPGGPRSEEHTSELQSLMRNSYAVFCLKT